MFANRRTRPRTRTGFALIEVAVSSLLAGLIFVAALRSVGAAIEGRIDNADRVRGMLLVQHMASELALVAYTDPEGGAGWGLDSGESTLSRLYYDDLDDYDTLHEGPPVNLLNMIPANCDDWVRTVDVDWVSPADPRTPVGSDQGVKRATIRALRNGRVVAEAVFLRSDG